MDFQTWITTDTERARKNMDVLNATDRITKLGLLANAGSFSLGQIPINELDDSELDYFYSMRFLPSVN